MIVMETKESRVMGFEEKERLIVRNTQEVINKDSLKELFDEKKSPVCYCGYEPSGEIHLGHFVTIGKLIELKDAGCQVKVLLADWHGWLNQKGDWDYMANQVKQWQAGFEAAGLKGAEFVVGSSFQRRVEYVDDMMRIAVMSTLNRALRSMQQVARDIDNAKVSQVIYPIMQVVDIKHLGVDIVEAGIEQRKIHMLAVEILEKIGYKVPVFVHTPLISSLKGPGSKMSSSEKESFISIRDDDDSIVKKINKAYCPEGVLEDNPILQIARLIVFPRVNEFLIQRAEKFGGDVLFKSYEELECAFKEKQVHPMDLKVGVGDYLRKILAPVRGSFKL